MKIEPVLEAESDIRAVHGGDVEAVARMYGLRPEEILDFSANINPAGPPPRVVARLAEAARDVRLLASYPEPDCRSLREAFAIHASVEPGNVIVANGTAALLDITLRALQPKRCLLPIPAFSEYRRAIRAAACECIPFPLGPEKQFALEPDAFAAALREKQCDCCILNNPHNPSGSSIPPEPLLRLLLEAAEQEITVLLDEAFIEYATELSLTREVASLPNVVALRSITKFYALAGMRVGFAIANARLAKALWTQVAAWPVTTLAAIAAAEALEDVSYAEQARSACARERKLLSDALAKTRIAVWPSAANFLLLKPPTGSLPVGQVCERLLLDHHILVRDCSSYEGLESDRYIRVAVRDYPANMKLISALNEIVAS